LCFCAISYRLCPSMIVLSQTTNLSLMPSFKIFDSNLLNSSSSNGRIRFLKSSSIFSSNVYPPFPHPHTTIQHPYVLAVSLFYLCTIVGALVASSENGLHGVLFRSFRVFNCRGMVMFNFLFMFPFGNNEV